MPNMMLLKYTSVWVTITFPEMKFNNLLSTELQSNIQCICNKSGCSADEGENIDFVFFQIHFNYFSVYYWYFIGLISIQSILHIFLSCQLVHITAEKYFSVICMYKLYMQNKCLIRSSQLIMCIICESCDNIIIWVLFSRIQGN